MIEPGLETAAVPALLERGDELQTLGRAVSAATAGHGGLVVIEGEPGIGKTSLVAHAVAVASAAGFAVLSGTPGELESAYAYGLIHDLFGATVAREEARRRLLVGAAAHARAVLVPGASPASLAPVDAFPIVHGLYWLTEALSDDRPILICVDDAQWADAPSLRALHYIAQRCHELRVLIVVATRPRLPDAPAELDVLCGMPGAYHLAPARLTRGAVATALARLRGGADADRALVDACHRVTGGNPFYLEVALHALASGRGDEPSVALVEGLAPRRVASGVLRRVARIGEDAARLARAVAILGGEATLHRAARMLEMNLDRTAAAADKLAHARIFEPGTLAFSHPIVRSSVLESLAAHERALAHRAAAQALSSEPDPPLDAVAAHLEAAPCVGDRAAVELLLRAARSDAARGVPARSVAWLARALAEPPPDNLRAEVMSDLGRAKVLTGDAAGGAGMLAQARALLPPGRPRAEVACDEGEALQAAGRWDLAAPAFERGLADAPVEDRTLIGRLQAGYVAAGWLDRSEHATAVDRADALVAAGAAESPLVALWVAYQRSVQAVGDHRSALALVHDAIAGTSIPVLQSMGQAVELAAGTLLATDALGEDAALLTSALEEAQRRGSMAKYAVTSYCRGWPNLHAGNLADAVADAQAAVDALASGWEMFYPAACAVLGLALLERGNLEQAERAVALDPDRWGGRLDYLVLIPFARGRIRLARGDTSGAVAELRTEAGRAVELGIRNPDMSPWRSWAAVALAGMGRRTEALELAEEEVTIARAWGAPRQVAVALRGMGVALGGSPGIEMLEEAVRVAATSEARLELARAQADLGRALRAAGHRADARDTLTHAAELAQRLGAISILGGIADELRVLGARPRRYALVGPASLTPSELRVARLVAHGRTNREVAQALFVTLKAVEYHLANAYRKLGISSRGELGAALDPTGARVPARGIHPEAGGTFATGEGARAATPSAHN